MLQFGNLKSKKDPDLQCMDMSVSCGSSGDNNPDMDFAILMCRFASKR